jgi:hypothetical protein
VIKVLYTLCADCIGKYTACCARRGPVNESLKSQYLNEKGAPPCSHWTDEIVGPHTSAVLTLSLTECLSKLSCRRCDCNIRGRFFMGFNCKLGVNSVMQKP